MEASQNDGSYPFSAEWGAAWLGESGVIVTTTAALSGSNGLWQFTGTSEDEWFASAFQDLAAVEGESFQASAMVRRAPGQGWAEGTTAHVRVQFFSGGNIILASFTSARATGASTAWESLAVTAGPAPKGTDRVRFACYLEKPSDTTGQSILNTDDCSLVRLDRPVARLSSRVLGIADNASATGVELVNLGNANLDWTIDVDAGSPWLSAPLSAGTLAPLATQQIVFNANRAGLPDALSHKGGFTLDTNGNDIEVDVHLEMPQAQATPQLPSDVRFYGKQLRVRDRLPGGGLSPPYHYIIKGTAWAPTSIGTDPSFRRQEFTKWAIPDVHLFDEMNLNTVRLFLDPGTGAAGQEVFDILHKYGIKAIVTVDDQGTGDSVYLQQVVTAYRNHPAVLGWAIGNEWNINLYQERFASLAEAAAATETMAQQCKLLDPNHPVFSILGDIDIDNLNPLTIAQEDTPHEVSTERIVNEICPSVDAWGLNIYRSDSFFNLFDQWESITDKPMLLSEYGTDAYRFTPYDVSMIDGEEDEAFQEETNAKLWGEIADHLSATGISNSCLGGTFFEWNEEWWKVKEVHGGEDDVQENLGFFGGHPDGFANEEWFGVVTADRRRRSAYFRYQSDYAAAVAPDDLDGDGLPDVWEYEIIDATPGSPHSISELEPGGDLDLDWLSNIDEYRGATDPLDPDSFSAITEIVATGGGIRLRWKASPDAQQVLERSTSLDDGAVWTALVTREPPSAADGEFLDTEDLGEDAVLYRLRTTRQP